ncbi:MAG: hypothetical protein P0120_02415 [Nitrospira sp.]|nr:hypothetical protein [Nitrospira sp.]
MDRTLINLLSILVGGAGLFTVLTGFNVPELNMSFWGENPYAVKRDAIDNTMKWMFTLVASLGLVLQIWAEIWGENLPDRLYDSSYYTVFSVIGLVVVGSLVWLLTGVGIKLQDGNGSLLLSSCNASSLNVPSLLFCMMVGHLSSGRNEQHLLWPRILRVTKRKTSRQLTNT